MRANNNAKHSGAAVFVLVGLARVDLYLLVLRDSSIFGDGIGVATMIMSNVSGTSLPTSDMSILMLE